MHDAYDAVFHGGLGFVATVFAVLATYPLQTLRTRMQVRHTHIHTYTHIHKQHTLTHLLGLSLSHTHLLPHHQVRTNKTPAHKTSSGSSLLQRDLCSGLREKLLSSAICEFTFFFARRVLENLFLPSSPPPPAA